MKGRHPGLTRAVLLACVLVFMLATGGLPLGNAAPERPTCAGRPATRIGTNGADTLRGTDGDDVIFGGGGNDTLLGLDGDDRLCGGGGADLLLGGDDENLINGGAGSDTASYEEAPAGILAFINIAGKPGGAIGRDAFFGSFVTDRFKSVENITGSPGHDILAGGPGPNRLSGGAGSDTFRWYSTDSGDDVWDGGEGTDRAEFWRATGPVTADLQGGRASVAGSPGTDSLTGIENLSGSPFTDFLSGDGGDNSIESWGGFAGDGDSISGLGGNDDLLGGAGPVVMDGGSGSDIMEAAGYQPIEISGGEDNDFFQHDDWSPLQSYDVASTFSGGPGVDRFSGTLGDDSMSGDGGDDNLLGGYGDDVLNGGEDFDRADGSNGTDTCIAVEDPARCASDLGEDDLVGDPAPPGKNSDLSVTMRPAPERDGVTEYLVSVTNAGPDPAEDVVVEFHMAGVPKRSEANEVLCVFDRERSIFQSAADCHLFDIPIGQTRRFHIAVAEGSLESPRHMAIVLHGFPSDLSTPFAGPIRDPEWTDNIHVLGAAPPQPKELPIVFVPGFLGSDIACGTDELWPALPNPEFDHMILQADGESNDQSDPCTASARPTGKIVEEGYGYKAVIEFLRSLPRDVFFLGYDWRKSPFSAVPDLDIKVDRALRTSRKKKVVLMAHSMGGLVARAYVEAHPDKVDRVVTIGTPFLGAPKPWLALAHGYTTPETNALDPFIENADLMEFARNAAGAYYLYPSERYIELMGGWLTYPPIGGDRLLTAAEVLTAVDQFSGNSTLLQQSYGAHAGLLQSVPPGDVDWQMVVGSGVPTLIRIDEPFPHDDPSYAFGNGDGTVPTESAAMGNVEPSAVHYVCGAEHGALPGKNRVIRIIKAFLLRGAPVTGLTAPCPLP